MSARGTVILGCLGNGIDFVFIKPLTQALVVADDGSTVDVMQLTTLLKSQIMVGGSCQKQTGDHFGIMTG